MSKPFIKPSFKSELLLKELKLGQKTSWTLPVTDEGTTVKFLPDYQIASFFSYDSISRTITFHGDDLKDNEETFVDKVFFAEIRLIDEDGHVSF